MAQIGETELDVRALGRALWRRAWLLIALALAVTTATYLALGSMDPVYTADTSLLIEERESPLTRPNPDANAAELDESAIQSHVEVLRSRQIANTVIDRLDLIHRPDFDPATRPSAFRSLLVLLGLREHPAEETIRQRIMDTYYGRLTVYPLAQSRVITVQFEAPDPELAAEVANEVAKAFVDLQQEAKRESAVAATDWLQQEIESLRGRVAEAEQAVADYRANNELFSVNDQQGSLSTQQLSEINAELARARAARAEAEARAAMIGSLLQDGGALDSSQEVLESPLVQRLRERQVALRSEIADLSTTFLPGHPRIRALQGQLNNLDGQVRQEVGRVQASLNTAARVAAARERSLLGSLNEAKVAVNRTSGQEIELRALEREAAAQRDLLESLLGRYREALARTNADYLPADARIISRAMAPGDPSFPNKPMISVAAGLTAFLLGAALLMMGEFSSGRAFRIVGYPGPLAAPPSAEPAVAVAPAAVVSTLRPSIVDPVFAAAPSAAALASAPGPDTPGVAETVLVRESTPVAVVAPIAAPDVSEPESVAPFVSEPEPLAEEMIAAAPAYEVAHEVADEPFLTSADPGELERLSDFAPVAIAAGLFDPRLEPELPFHAVPSAMILPAAEEPAPVFAEDGDDRELGSGAAHEPAPIAATEEDGSFDAVQSDPTNATADDLATMAPLAAEFAAAAPGEIAHPDIAPVGIAADESAPSDDGSAELVSGDVTPADITPADATPTDVAETLPVQPVAVPVIVPAADRPEMKELAEHLATPAVRLALFAGAKGGEGAGEVAHSVATRAAGPNNRFVLIDVGKVRSDVLGGPGEPGLAELLAGEFAFGEVIRRDEGSRVHIMPMGNPAGSLPLQRLQLVIGALTHTYDKVVVVANSIEDWPHEQVKPDLAAIVCGPGVSDESGAAAQQAALDRGARTALVLPFEPAQPRIDARDESAAA
jgi:uncharacterized protein involved in exopolysaccharide biosynthesis